MNGPQLWQKMNNNIYSAQVLQNKIKEILLKEWDPIGIQEIPEAQDEYDAYVSFIYKLLISRKAEDEVFDYLWWLETEHMGLIGDKQRTLAIAQKLIKISIK